LVEISGLQSVVIILVVMGFVAASSLFAARAALRVDPALVLREGVS
jgi:putative ABC transport system permease protein